MTDAGGDEVRHEGSARGDDRYLVSTPDQLVAQSHLVLLDPADIKGGEDVENPHGVGL